MKSAKPINKRRLTKMQRKAIQHFEGALGLKMLYKDEVLSFEDFWNQNIRYAELLLAELTNIRWE